MSSCGQRDWQPQEEQRELLIAPRLQDPFPSHAMSLVTGSSGRRRQDPCPGRDRPSHRKKITAQILMNRIFFIGTLA